jgi:hypothetical protein
MAIHTDDLTIWRFKVLIINHLDTDLCLFGNVGLATPKLLRKRICAMTFLYEAVWDCSI